MSHKCFLCARQFEVSTSRSRSGTPILSHSESSFLLKEVLGLRSVDKPNTKRKYLNRLAIKLQKVCYCTECLDIILNACTLVTELEILTAKVSTEKMNIVQKLKETCEEISNKINETPGMLQALRSEIIGEINKTSGTSGRKSLRLLEASANNFERMSKEEFKTRKEGSTQTENTSENSQNGHGGTPKNQDTVLDAAPVSVAHGEFISGSEEFADQNLNDLPETNDFNSTLNKRSLNGIRKEGVSGIQISDSDAGGSGTTTNMPSQYVVQASKQMKIVRYYCGACNERFDDFDSLHAHDLLHLNPGQQMEIRRDKSPTRVPKSAEGELSKENSGVSQEVPTATKTGYKTSQQKLKVVQNLKVSKRNPQVLNQDPQALSQNPTASNQIPEISKQNRKTSRQKPQVRKQNPDGSKQKPRVRRSNGKEKRQKSLIIREKRAAAYYQPINCEECGKVLSNHNKLKDHILTIHRGEGKFKCELCEFTCQIPVKLKRHMINRHSDARNYICDLCNKGFKRKDTLQAHKKIHEGKTLHECKLCSCKFTFATSLRKHISDRDCLKSQSQFPYFHQRSAQGAFS